MLGRSLGIIGRAADHARRRNNGAARSYQEIVRVILGPAAERAITLIQLFYLVPRPAPPPRRRRNPHPSLREPRSERYGS